MATGTPEDVVKVGGPIRGTTLKSLLEQKLEAVAAE